MDIQKIFDTQKERSIQLRTESLKKRKKRLTGLKSWILANKNQIRQAIYEDLKRSSIDTDIAEIYTSTSELNKAIRNLTEWTRAKHVDSGMLFFGTKGAIRPEPRGVCLIISPWNFPFQLACVPLISCLAAGNTAMIKPSEHTPATSKLIEKMVNNVFDSSEVAVVEGAVNETTELLQLPFDHIFFTGSTAVGKIVMEAAAKNLTSVTLELGGKSPVVIDDSANISDAAKKIIWGRFMNNSQTCIAPDYIFIHESKKEQFIEAAKKQIVKMFDSKNQGIQKSEEYSRIVHERHASRLIDMLKEAKSLGAKVETGGTYELKDKFIAPTILSNVDEKSKVWTEEIFGPIMPLKTYQNLDQVIQHINSKEKPLSLYLFTQKKSVQNKVISSTSSGSIVINDVVLQYAHLNLPFGGINHSGIGKSHGYFGFMAFSHKKSLLKQRIGLTNTLFFYPPFGGFKKWLVGFLIRWF